MGAPARGAQATTACAGRSATTKLQEFTTVARNQMQVAGDKVRRWLASGDAEPALLVGIEVSHLVRDAGGPVCEIGPNEVVIAGDGGRRERIPLARMGEWVFETVPRPLALRIAAAHPVPPAWAEHLRRLGFDAEPLGRDDAQMLIATDEALSDGGEIAFAAVERLWELATRPDQARAALRLLERICDHPTRAAGHARVRLASLASQRGDGRAVFRWTQPALRDGEDPRLTRPQQAILLTVRSAFLGQVAQDCARLTEAWRLARMAMAIAGRSEHLDNTFRMLRRRAEALGCRLG